MAINFRHGSTGVLKKCPEGFSWTFLFFGPLVAIARSMWAHAAISIFTCYIANLYYVFFINKLYARKLMESGYVPAGEVDRKALESKGLITKTAVELPQKAA